MKPHLLFLTLALLPLTLAAGEKKVHFKMTVLDYEADPIKKHRCKHFDILKHRPSEKTGEAPILTLELSKKTAEDPASFELCKKVFTNLTRLDEQKVRDDVASILEEMPCAPRKDLVVEFGAKRNPDAAKEYPGIPHDYIVNKINFEECMDDMPALCSFPSAHTSWDSQSVIIDHDKMMIAFKRCRDALIKKVKEEGLDEKWAAEKKAKEEQEKKAAESATVTPTEGKKP